MPADAVLPCGPIRSSPHIPAGSFYAAAHGNAADAAPVGQDAAARNVSYKAPGGIDVDAAKRARGHAAGGSGCSSNAAGDGGTGGQQMGYQPYQQGYPYQQMPPLGYGQQFHSSTSRDISSRTSRCRSSSTTPGPSRCLRSLTSSGLKVFNSKCRRCRVLQQPAAQMMYPNAANRYAQPQPDVFVSDAATPRWAIWRKIKRAVLPTWRGRLETRPHLVTHAQ